MNATTTTFDQGTIVDVTLTDDTVLTGEFVKIDNKGVVHLRVDGKIVTRAASRVESIEVHEDDEDESSEDGYTSADLAEMFGTSARALRRRLRALSMGVGKGNRYALTDAELATVRKSIEGEPIED